MTKKIKNNISIHSKNEIYRFAMKTFKEAAGLDWGGRGHTKRKKSRRHRRNRKSTRRHRRKY